MYARISLQVGCRWIQGEVTETAVKVSDGSGVVLITSAVDGRIIGSLIRHAFEQLTDVAEGTRSLAAAAADRAEEAVGTEE